jgi:hypothetical protein
MGQRHIRPAAAAASHNLCFRVLTVEAAGSASTRMISAGRFVGGELPRGVVHQLPHGYRRPRQRLHEGDHLLVPGTARPITADCATLACEFSTASTFREVLVDDVMQPSRQSAENVCSRHRVDRVH